MADSRRLENQKVISHGDVDQVSQAYLMYDLNVCCEITFLTADALASRSLYHRAKLFGLVIAIFAFFLVKCANSLAVVLNVA